MRHWLTANPNSPLINSQPQFAIKAEKDKACGKSCLFATFNIRSGNIADCLGRCLENCRCKSFQICQNTKCQLCSSHKVENSSLLHYKDGRIYVTYEMTNWTETFQVRDQSSSNMTSHMNSHISIDRFHGSHVKFGFISRGKIPISHRKIQHLWYSRKSECTLKAD